MAKTSTTKITRRNKIFSRISKRIWGKWIRFWFRFICIRR
jgi:hypothetical protein